MQIGWPSLSSERLHKFGPTLEHRALFRASNTSIGSMDMLVVEEEWNWIYSVKVAHHRGETQQ